MRQNKPIGEVQNYAYIHYWLGKAYGKANKCESPDCPGTSKRFEWAKLRDRPYAKYRENFWQLCKHCHMLYDGAKAWNKGIRAKDHPRLQAALDKAHAAVRGSVAWNRQIAAWLVTIAAAQHSSARQTAPILAPANSFVESPVCTNH
jgi:hypothetical protein